MGRTFENILATIIIILGLVFFLPSVFPRRGRQMSNDSAAVANLRTINTAQVTYQSGLVASGKPGTFGTMNDLIDVRLLDDTFAGTKAGYNYSVTLDATGSAYTAEAVPASIKTGRYGYYSFPDAVVRYSTDASLAPAGQSGRSVQ